MSVPPYTSTKHTLESGHQDFIGLRELRCTQAVKGIIEMDLKRAAICTLLSHAFVARRETRAGRG
jgi:hypothetical protein